MTKISPLKNPIQNYPWGSRTFIPQLMGEAAPADKPQAELWMGVHPKAPSQVMVDGEWISLPEWIQKNPEQILGKAASVRFSNNLPFLFKVLAAARPLSIQAHPDRNQAREGFARENRMQIPMDAPHRNYRDENHKPEILCALTPLWALSGFRKIDDLMALADRIAAPALKDKALLVRRSSEAEGLKAFFSHLMTMDKGAQRQLVREVVHDIGKHSTTESALEWVVRLNGEYPGDMGVLSPIFMNVVHLQPGEAIYTPSGRLHAYLEGAAIELMTNSDNVLRGGLTSKNVDVPGLLRILNFTPDDVDILRPERHRDGQSIYRTPAEEFLLSLISIGEGSVFESSRTRSAEIMICTEGKARIADLGSKETLVMSKGTALIVPADVEQYRIEGKGTIYKATVPLQ